MEEILASIRQIISEDSEASSGERTGGVQPPAAPQDKADAASVQAEAEAFAMVDAGFATSRPDPEPEPEPQIAPAAVAEPAPESRRTPGTGSDEYLPRRQPAVEPQPRAQGTGLLSREQGVAVSDAFGTLAQTMLTHNSRTLEDVVEEMMRPMLKNWLDDNLPSLVERLVKDEIERVSRGRR